MLTDNNTQVGAKAFPTAVDLTGREGQLARIVNVGGVAGLGLPATTADIVPFVIADIEASNSAVGVPLTASKNARVRLRGAVLPGQLLTLAGGADLGRVILLSGPGRYIGVAEETGVDNQLVLMRPITGVV